MDGNLKAVLAGEGGQGVQAIAEILADAANREGKNALYIPNFGIEQRGGVSLAYVQVSNKAIGAPKFATADLVAALSRRAVVRTRQYVDQHTLLIYDASLVAPPEVEDAVVGLQSYDTLAPDAFAERTGRLEKVEKPIVPPSTSRIISIPATDIAKNELHPRVFNMIILGLIVGLTEAVELETVLEALDAKLNRKFEQNPELRELNLKALEKGRSAAAEGAGSKALS
ncbi:MAG: 2-oxoacid:acceptor oxidoreductase family protein [Dethiobacteria bacterium]|jgi:2-oxoglutarate ferredoxin oxidoreductase subunit gamma